ncbi:HlyD family type I secretion periplasmic adaptor subunit [Aestuariispira insulae]|uniref:Membrane fusion protein (MFP) family protein n=1 Tax=Aestuariispira insulae TaxID=1461337 RepID=A0A3D9HZ48_9PROT|nr:HlyD family type I secretion periplasmic adaptor subunit [Aestuariispira insulae]RED54176.1 adhesin transport system membrane fusion protein [Aestuariispira insulae]
MSKKQTTASLPTHLLLWLLVAAISAAVFWASTGRLDIVALASGEVIPSSQLKQVQHLEGGVLKEIMVREGEAVKAGQVLAVLESSATDADLGELQVRLTALEAEIIRLDAELSQEASPAFPDIMRAAYPQLIERQMALFQSRLRNRQDEITVLNELIRQRQLEADQIRARLNDQAAQLKLVEEQVRISDELLAEALSNRYQHLSLLKEAQELRGRITQDQVARQKALAGAKEAQARLAAVKSGFEKDARETRALAQRNFNELSQRLQKFQASQQRTVLRSPVDGIVKTLYRVTVGGVLKPGDPLADIVPAGDRLVIEAALPTGDIGYVRTGQAAKVRLASGDAMRFAALNGTVTTISPDTWITEAGQPFYKVRIQTDADHFRRDEITYRLYPGMTVNVGIQTGTRTVMDYLLEPFLGVGGQAFRER